MLHPPPRFTTHRIARLVVDGWPLELRIVERDARFHLMTNGTLDANQAPPLRRRRGRVRIHPRPHRLAHLARPARRRTPLPHLQRARRHEPALPARRLPRVRPRSRRRRRSGAPLLQRRHERRLRRASRRRNVARRSPPMPHPRPRLPRRRGPFRWNRGRARRTRHMTHRGAVCAFGDHELGCATSRSLSVSICGARRSMRDDAVSSRVPRPPL